MATDTSANKPPPGSAVKEALEEEELLETSTTTISAVDARRLAAVLGLEYRTSLAGAAPPKELVYGDFGRIIGSWGKQFKVIPLGLDENGLTVAVSDPLAVEAADTLRLCYDCPVHLVVAPPDEIIRAINSVRTSLMSDRDSTLEAQNADAGSEDISSTLKIDVTDAEDEDAPIIRYVNTLIFRAASQRASDIHIEPFENELKVRFRIDGVLQDVDSESKMFQPAILSRVKVMANLNIAEKRLPQDGRIGLKIAGQDVDIRVSTVPTRYGERIVLRLLDKASILLDLASLGFSADIGDVVHKIIRKSHGIILVTGPTGSGKTTTLYACLSHINAADKNILTIEDPIEYELTGIGQMQVNPKIDFTFANGLRAILRQDPDVVMVGEIRDIETVEIAIQASLTGHLVFSTLHTNDAPGALTRLLDMGAEPYLISSSLIGVMAQRLVRRLCTKCRIAHELLDSQCRELGLDPLRLQSRAVYRARDTGCNECQFTGYRGRMGIHEMLLIDDNVRNMIMARANANQIRAAASGLSSLRADGAKKILQGVTSFDEVLRVTQEDTAA
ncbi:MAG TPA: type II secretion system ATPase GspE [Oligoflexia bacterium]|nr:type II secretion system ATPase GspE [Oligoflexia bacterium]